MKIPASILDDELFEMNNKFERIMLSDDNKFLMCGHVILKLSENSDAVESIGCISYSKNHSVIEFRFNNLLDPSERKFIKMLLDDKERSLVMFDMEMPPIIHPEHPKAMYFACCVD